MGDNKASHEDPAVLYNLIETIRQHFGEIKVTRGNKHMFLGMNITMRDDNKIDIDMAGQLQKRIDVFGEKFEVVATSPATRHLFFSDESAELLDDKKVRFFIL